MSSMDDPLASTGLSAVIEPGLGASSVLVLDEAGARVAQFEAAGGMAGMAGLLGLVTDCFDIDRWLLLDNGVAGEFFADDVVTMTCDYLEIDVELTDPLSLWGEPLVIPSWPERLQLVSPWREFWSWLWGCFRWSPA